MAVHARIKCTFEEQMNRAFSANDIAVNMSMGRCPRLWMRTAPSALDTYSGRTISAEGCDSQCVKCIPPSASLL